WTRVDRIRENYHSTNYYFRNGAVVAVHDYRSVSVTSFARAVDLSHRNYWPRNTGERQTYLGETCTVWEVSRTISEAPGGSNSFHLSCITDDGIELWQRSIYGSNETTPTMATRVERRPVAADEVKPPRSLLMLDWWDRDAPSTISGTETRMELSARSVNAGK